jgi:O-methyltransferase involved in polyketide biosynthesis
MHDHQASRTAEYMVFFRALETAEPPARRPFADPYAFPALSAPLRTCESTRQMARRYCQPLDRREPGSQAYRVAAAIRER